MSDTSEKLEEDLGKPVVIKVPALVYSRVVGYYSNVRNFNKGKKQEFKERREYKPDLTEIPDDRG